MRKYECLYIIASNVEDSKRNELIEKFRKMAGASATVEKWGIKKFARPINYRGEGFYVLMNFESENDLPAKIEALMNITEGIVRSLFVVKDDKQIAQDAVRKVQRAEYRAAKAAEFKDTPFKPAQ